MFSFALQQKPEQGRAPSSPSTQQYDFPHQQDRSAELLWHSADRRLPERAGRAAFNNPMAYQDIDKWDQVSRHASVAKGMPSAGSCSATL